MNSPAGSGGAEGAGVNVASARSAWVALAVTVAATAVAMLVDRTVFELFNAPKVYDKDLGRLLRVMGFAGTWVALALAVGLTSDGSEPSRQRARRRGWLVFWSPVLAGALAEVLKIVVRRERPLLNDGAYGFRPWDERTWSGSGLAFPSSHTAVAFGGAFMLARMFPRAKWVGIVLAVGCGITRILARAHFVSDVVFAAGLGWLVSWFLWRRWAPKVAAVALALSLTAMSPASVQAQAAAPAAARESVECLQYERCALGLVARFSGLVVVRGQQEEPVAMLGFFIPGGSLDAAFVGDTIAQRFGRQALRARRVGAVATIGGALTLAAAVLVAVDGQADAAVAPALGVLGSAQMLGAVYYQFKADADLSRAVWYYNRRFSR